MPLPPVETQSTAVATSREVIITVCDAGANGKVPNEQETNHGAVGRAPEIGKEPLFGEALATTAANMTLRQRVARTRASANMWRSSRKEQKGRPVKLF